MGEKRESRVLALSVTSLAARSCFCDAKIDYALCATSGPRFDTVRGLGFKSPRAYHFLSKFALLNIHCKLVTLSSASWASPKSTYLTPLKVDTSFAV
jgi:hypothetical protein